MFIGIPLEDLEGFKQEIDMKIQAQPSLGKFYIFLSIFYLSEQNGIFKNFKNIKYFKVLNPHR